jgi:pimeloyl-ACP methyl ester carboxylesterase
VVDLCDTLEIEHAVILGQSFGGVVALGVAIRHPELAAKLIVSSSIGRFRLDRALPMFERLGGKEARDVAERYFHDPNEERLDELMAVCLPLYNPTPIDPDAIVRVVMRPEVGFHFFRGEGFTYDWFGELDRIRCPTLILAGARDPITTLADHEELAAGDPGLPARGLPRRRPRRLPRQACRGARRDQGLRRRVKPVRLRRAARAEQA